MQSPGNGAFVRNVRNDLVSGGYGVSVLHILPFHDLFLRRKILLEFITDLFKHNRERIFVPFISFSHRTILGLDMMRYSFGMLRMSLFITTRILNLKGVYDLAYGKFLSEGGFGAYYLSKLLSIPFALDLGESYSLERYANNEILKTVLTDASTIFCVSERLCLEALKLGGIKDRIVFAPNSANSDIFYPRDKHECRNILGLEVPCNKLVVCFVGHFINRKGPNRVLEAINFGDEFVGVFLGKGPIEIVGEKVLYAGQVDHDLLPIWLNAADIFVLPTLGEGWCNAIEEAYCCGLPLVVSEIEDVRRQLDKRQAYFFDPKDVYSIYRSLRAAKKNVKNLDITSLNKRSDIILSEILNERN